MSGNSSDEEISSVIERIKSFGFGFNLSKGKEKIIKYIKCLVIGLATGIANGLFGSGGGTIVVPSMIFLLKEDEHKAHATAILIILPLTVVSLFFYLRSGHMDWQIAWKVILGGIAGGYIGARLLNKCPENILRKIFAVFMIAAAIKLIL
ncbi:MAG TPA: TSUP family transporter [bacterium]|nr:TSUP family transporter [bacterium]